MPDYTSLVTAKTPAAPGHVNYGIPVEYIPRLYAAKVLVKYYAKTVLTAITNTDYEGQIKNMGDTVVIRTRPDVKINDYYKGKKLSYEQVSSPSIQLEIDKAKDYAFEIDDIDVKQADIALSDQFLSDAAEQMAIVIDQDVLSNIVLDPQTANKGNAAGQISANQRLGSTGTDLTGPLDVRKAWSGSLTTNEIGILDLVVNAKVVMNEANVPMSGRWMVLPAELCALIDRSDFNQVQVSGDDKSRLYDKGWIGNLAGFDIFDSNLLTSTSTTAGVNGVQTIYDCPFGQRDAVTFAAQLVKNDSVKLQETFGRGYRGLQVYGFLTQKTNGLGLIRAYANPAGAIS